MAQLTEELCEDAERLCSRGATVKEVADYLGLDAPRLRDWYKQFPEFKGAIDRGRRAFQEAKASGESVEKVCPAPKEPWQNAPVFPQIRVPLLIDRTRGPQPTPNGIAERKWRFVWGWLPRPLLGGWEIILAYHKMQNDVEIDTFIESLTQHVRQHYFFFAYVQNHFDVSMAMLMVLLTRSELEDWVINDAEFSPAWKDMMWHKKNSYEATLMRACRAGETAAIVFANRTINAHRGYKERAACVAPVESKKVAAFDIDSLGLPLQTRQQILEAIRSKKNPDNGSPPNASV